MLLFYHLSCYHGEAKVLCMDAAVELAYTSGTDFLVFNGRFWEESKIRAQSIVMQFLDRQREDAASNLEARKEALLAEGISELAIMSGGKTLEQVSLFDIYEGAQVKEGCKSMAYALSFRSPDR